MPTPEFQSSSSATACRQHEQGHLGWCAVRLVHWPNGFQANLITETRSRRVGPLAEFRPRPLKAMIGVAHLALRQSREQRVVFTIGCGDDDVARPRKLEQHTLQRNQAWRIQMFDHL